MAVCKYSKFLTYSNHEAFDQCYEPCDNTPLSGIYRCEACGREVTSIRSHPLPPPNHHQHTAAQGKTRWRLIVGHYTPDADRQP